MMKTKEVNKPKETIEEICLNIFLGNNKIIPKPYDIEHEYCYGCTLDKLNKICPHYKPLKIYVNNVNKSK